MATRGNSRWHECLPLRGKWLAWLIVGLYFSPVIFTLFVKLTGGGTACGPKESVVFWYIGGRRFELRSR